MPGLRYFVRGALVSAATIVLAAFPSGHALAGKMPRKPLSGAAYQPAGPPATAAVAEARSVLATAFVSWGVAPPEARRRAGQLPAVRAVELSHGLEQVQAGSGLGQAYVILIGLVVLLLILDLLDEGIFIGKASGAKQQLMADLGGNLPWLEG